MKRTMIGLMMATLVVPAAFAQKAGNPQIQRIAHQTAEGFQASHDRAAVALNLTARDVALQLGFDSDFNVRNDRTHADGRRTIHADQIVNGMKVWGSGLVVNMDRDGFVTSTAGSLVEGRFLPTQPEVTPEGAVRRSLKGHDNARMIGKAPQLTYVVNTKDEVVLAWMTQIEYTSDIGPHVDLVFTDALTGKRAARHPQVKYARSLNTKNCNQTTTNCGTVSTSSNNINTGDNAIDSAHNYAIATYNYYANNHGRDSINDNGMTLVSNVHYDQNYNNAYWWNNEMTYGDGDGTTFAPLSQDADVVAHELTHGVTETSSNLVYASESGALNEALSDIFGALVDYQEGATGAAIWLIGEDIYTPNGSSTDALRYMANPTQDGYSTDYYPTRLYSGNCSPNNNNDQCGVHGNSGIANLAFKLLVDGGSHPRGVTSTVVPGIGFDAAGDIFYYANTQCLTSSSNFEAARNCTVAGASTQALKDAVNAAWDAVGVPGGGSTPPSGGGELTNGVAETGLSGSTGTETDFFMDVPAGATNLSFQMSGGSGDADLYVRFGSAPTTSSYDCRPYLNGNSENCSFASPSAGTYYVMVRAYSTYSNVSLVGSYDSSAPNVGPTAAFSSSTSDLTASFSNTSSDSDGTISSSSWTFGDGGTSSATNPSHTYASAGTYSVTLTVTDNDGASDSVSHSVTVTAPANVGPTAAFSSSTSDLTASFSNTSSDSDGTISSSSWTFGDGGTSSATNPSHTYASAGTYSVTLTVTDNDGASDSVSHSVTVTDPPAGGGMQNGVPLTGLADSQGGQEYYTVDIPAGATNLVFTMSGGSGDADLYVRFGSQPTTSSYDCRPYRSGNNETCTFASPSAGTYHVMIRAYSTYSGVSLVATWDEPGGGGGACADSGSATNVSGAKNSETRYTWDVPSCASTFTVQTTGGTGDADLYVRFGSQPTTSSYDCRPWLSGNNETCSFNSPSAGTWHIMLRGYSAYSGVDLSVGHE